MEGERGGEVGGGRSRRDTGVFKRLIECISPHLLGETEPRDWDGGFWRTWERETF